MDVAQLVEAIDSDSIKCQFESDHPHHHARLAQLVEALASNPSQSRFESGGAHQRIAVPSVGCKPTGYETDGWLPERFDSSAIHHLLEIHL